MSLHLFFFLISKKWCKPVHTHSWGCIFLPAVSYSDAPGTEGAQQTPDAVRGDDEGPDKRELPMLQIEAISLHTCAVHQLFNVLTTQAGWLIIAAECWTTITLCVLHKLKGAVCNVQRTPLPGELKSQNAMLRFNRVGGVHFQHVKMKKKIKLKLFLFLSKMHFKMILELQV